MKRWRRAAEALAVLLVLYFVGAYIAAHWEEVHGYRWEIAPGALVAATALAALALAGFGSLWTLLLRSMGEPIGPRDALRLWFTSNLARYVPGKVWQITGLAYLARRQGISPVHAVGASLLLQLLVLATGTLLFVLTVPAELGALSGPAAAAALVAFAAGVTAFFVTPAFDLAYGRGARLLGQPAPAERLSVARKLQLGSATALAWVVYGTAFWLFLRGTTGRPPPLGTTVGICLGGYLGGFLAFFAPGGLGVREGLYALLLQAYMPAPVALAVAVLARIWVTLIEVLLAGASVVAARRAPAARAVSDAPLTSDG